MPRARGSSQVLKDAGLRLYRVDERPRTGLMSCAVGKSRDEALAVLLDPDSLYSWEKAGYGSNLSSPLWYVINGNNYELTLLLLKNGAGISFNNKSFLHLTREEHLLLLAERALKKRKTEALRAFPDAGFGPIVEAARNENNVAYVRNRAGLSTGGGGSGLLGVAGLVAGVALGGDVGTVVAVASGLADGSGDGEEGQAPVGSGPLALPTNRAELGLALAMTTAPHRGLKVTKVVGGGPGEAAGMLTDDVVVRIAGVPVATPASFFVAGEKAAKTPTFPVEYYRDGAFATTTFAPPAPSSSPSASTSSAGKKSPESISVLEALERLANLRDRGVITGEEFQTLKAEMLNRD